MLFTLLSFKTCRQGGDLQDDYRLVNSAIFADFYVHVLAEDDHVMKCNAKDFVSKLWSVENNNSSSEPPSKVCQSFE